LARRPRAAWLDDRRSTLDLFGRGCLLDLFSRTTDLSALQIAAEKSDCRWKS
jgi:hypothetical protein